MGIGEQVEDDAAWGPPSVPSDGGSNGMFRAGLLETWPILELSKIPSPVTQLDSDQALYTVGSLDKKQKTNLWCVHKSEQPQNVFEHFSFIIFFIN